MARQSFQCYLILEVRESHSLYIHISIFSVVILFSFSNDLILLKKKNFCVFIWYYWSNFIWYYYYVPWNFRVKFPDLVANVRNSNIVVSEFKLQLFHNDQSQKYSLKYFLKDGRIYLVSLKNIQHFQIYFPHARHVLNTFEFWMLCAHLYVFVAYISFAPVISTRIHRYVNYSDIKVLMMVTETETFNVDFTS